MPDLGVSAGQQVQSATEPTATWDQGARPVSRLLDPMGRISEVLFGLIMVLTVTCSISVATMQAEDIRELLIGALGCNLAWGIIDALMFLMGRVSEQGQGILALRTVQSAAHPGEAYAAITSALPPLLAKVLSPVELETMRQRLNHLPGSPARPALRTRDYLAASGVFALVFCSTLPVLIPFVVMGHSRLTMRVSNGIAILMLFLTGYAFGRHIEYRPWCMGASMVALGLVLVGIAVALGG